MGSLRPFSPFSSAATGTAAPDNAATGGGVFKGILLDLDNTLYPYLPAHQAAQTRLLQWLGQQTGQPISRLEPAYQAARQQVHRRLAGTAASHHRLLYIQTLLESLGLSPLVLARQGHRLYWDTFYENMQLFPGVLPFLARCHAQGIRVAIVTDLLAEIQYEKIERLKLQPYLSALVTSEEAGADKPAAAMYQLAMQKLELPASDVCMIGDHWEKDILGAAKQHIVAYWYNPDPLAQPGELPEALCRHVYSFHQFETLEAQWHRDRTGIESAY
ncbi:MAG: HAD family hydrolase [Candidatus Melainabacteria bacterium]|nr:HAD family hydrolase [Candidatus Melainabacteria bacterium]